MSLADYLNKTPMPSAAADAVAPSPSVAPHPRVTEKNEEAGLILVCHDLRTWGFPWSYYIESLLVPAGVTETDSRAAHDVLTVVFASREVILRGHSLASLHEAVVRHRVWKIRETPEKLLTAADLAGGAPLVVEITVRGRGK
jgi:hypothetical protein